PSATSRFRARFSRAHSPSPSMGSQSAGLAMTTRTLRGRAVFARLGVGFSRYRTTEVSPERARKPPWDRSWRSSQGQPSNSGTAPNRRRRRRPIPFDRTIVRLRSHWRWMSPAINARNSAEPISSGDFRAGLLGPRSRQTSEGPRRGFRSLSEKKCSEPGGASPSGARSSLTRYRAPPPRPPRAFSTSSSKLSLSWGTAAGFPERLGCFTTAQTRPRSPLFMPPVRRIPRNIFVSPLYGGETPPAGALPPPYILIAGPYGADSRPRRGDSPPYSGLPAL